MLKILSQTPFRRGIRRLVKALIISVPAALLSACAGESAVNSGVPAVEEGLKVGAIDRSGYLAREDVQQFISDVSTRNGLPRLEVERLLSGVEKQQKVIDLISKPAEGKPWHEYRKIFVTPARAEAGAEFWRNNRATLERAEKTYQVPAEIIVAIIGVETFYGRNQGTFPVLDTLVTLGFDYPPRGEFFRQELENFLLLRREESLDFNGAIGSYAGAMGRGQFISSSYRNYSVDFDGDGKRDLFNSDQDAIGSVANYFKEHGWLWGGPVIAEVNVQGDGYKTLLDLGLEPTITETELHHAGVRFPEGRPRETIVSFFELEDEYNNLRLVGYNNFYVITRYNRSPRYALAVYELSLSIKRTLEAGDSVGQLESMGEKQ